MNKLKIGPRRAPAFGSVLLITAAIAFVGVMRLGALKDAAQSTASAEMERSSLSQGWTAYINVDWDRTTALIDLIGEICAASQEQTRGVSQVGKAVTPIDQSTQQDAELVEGIAAAAGSLGRLSHELPQMVGVFRLNVTNAQSQRLQA